MTSPASTEGRATPREILPLLEGVKKASGGWTAFCPAHDDGAKSGARSGQSLSLSEAGLLHCFTGCSFKAIMEALEARGLRNRLDERRTERERVPQPARAVQNDGLSWREVAVYDFRQQDGTPVAQHVRFEAPDPAAAKGRRKRFIWRVSATDKRTLKQAEMTEDDLPLFGAELLTGAEMEAWVNIGEGEGVALALRARNELAVCFGGGASQRNFGTALDVLRGRKVRIWPDNDAPGAEYAAVLRRAITAIGAARVVVMPPVGGPGDDLVNYFGAGGSLSTLLAGVLEADSIAYEGADHIRVRLATDAGEVTFDASEIEEGPRSLDATFVVTWQNPTAPRPWDDQRLNVLSASGCEGFARVLGKHFPEAKLPWGSLLNRVGGMLRRAVAEADISEAVEPDPDERPAKAIVEGYIIAGGGTILFGPPKRGKSQAAMAMAVTADSGLRNSVFRVNGPHRVLYVNLERSRSSMLARLARVNVALGLDARRPLRFIHARGQSFAHILGKVRKAVREHDIDVVILDSISRGGFGDLNTNQVANSAIDALNSLGVAWLAIGHSPRPKEGDGAPHLYGSIHQDAGADVLVSLASTDSGPNRLLVSLNVTDGNDMAKPPALDLVYEFDDGGLTAIRRATDAEVIDLEPVKVLTVKQRILASLRDDGPAGSGELAKRLKLQASNVSRDLVAMARDGLVTGKKGSTYAIADGVYQPSYHDNINDNRPSYHVAPPTPYRGVGDDRGDKPSDNSLDERITCSRCRREGLRLSGFDPASTPDNELPLCASCYDDVLEGRVS